MILVFTDHCYIRLFSNSIIVSYTKHERDECRYCGRYPSNESFSTAFLCLLSLPHEYVLSLQLDKKDSGCPWSINIVKIEDAKSDEWVIKIQTKSNDSVLQTLPNRGSYLKGFIRGLFIKWRLTFIKITDKCKPCKLININSSCT